MQTTHGIFLYVFKLYINAFIYSWLFVMQYICENVAILICVILVHSSWWRTISQFISHPPGNVHLGNPSFPIYNDSREFWFRDFVHKRDNFSDRGREGLWMIHHQISQTVSNCFEGDLPPPAVFKSFLCLTSGLSLGLMRLSRFPDLKGSERVSHFIWIS